MEMEREEVEGGPILWKDYTTSLELDFGIGQVIIKNV
jgi:hypothetical protein